MSERERTSEKDVIGDLQNEVTKLNERIAELQEENDSLRGITPELPPPPPKGPGHRDITGKEGY